MISIALFVIAISAADKAAEPTQIGLLCKGTQTIYSPSAGTKEEPWERTFSMDFKGAKAWVVGAQSQFDIIATETRIMFWSGYEINRTTGDLTGRDDNRFLPTRVSAACEPTKYTPMPAKKF